MDRRSFISALALLGVQAAVPGASAKVFAAASAAPMDRRRRVAPFDDNLVCIISDLHTNPGAYQPRLLERVVADILKLNPLPSNVIALGDLAYLTGRPEEYALLKEIIAPIEAAGIRLTLGMGNHDRRVEFAEAFPDHAASSLMKDRYVYVVETPRADFIVLDSLQESEDRSTWITPGALPESEIEWLRERLGTYESKPVFVMSHHPIEEIGIRSILMESPTCCGYIYGHNHEWDPGRIHKNYHEYDVLRTLCVPSTGHWGDIGYVLLDLGQTQATARLQQYEYFFPYPLPDGEPKPAQWKMIEDENRGATCSFSDRAR